MSEYIVREATVQDLPAWWELRLRSLHDHPDAFGSDYEESRRTGPTYIERGYFDGGINRLFAAFTSAGDLVAHAGTYEESGKRSHIGNVISVYTHPDHRGNVLASRLVQAAIEHLQSFPAITSIRISVNADNHIAFRTYENWASLRGVRSPLRFAQPMDRVTMNGIWCLPTASTVHSPPERTP